MERAPSIYQELKFLQKSHNFEIDPFAMWRPSKQPFDWRTRHLQVNTNHWPFLQESIVLSNQLQELLWIIMNFSKCDLWIEINERIVETAYTIFTAGSLKASRTETRITTTIIMIKTGCSILTRVTFTRQDFCHGNIWGEGRWWLDRQVI